MLQNSLNNSNLTAKWKNIPDLDAEFEVFFLFASKIRSFIVYPHPPSLAHVEFIPSLAFLNRTMGR